VRYGLRFLPKRKFTWLLIALLVYGYLIMKEEQSLDSANDNPSAVSSVNSNNKFLEKTFVSIVDSIQNTDAGKAIMDAVVQQSVESRYGAKEVSSGLAEEKGEVILVDKTIGEGGATLQCGSIASIYYDAYIDGVVKFDSNRNDKEPLVIDMQKKNVIKGLKIGLLGMKKGGKRKIAIPSFAAYDNPDFKNDMVDAKTPVLYDVELVDLKKGYTVNDIMSLNTIAEGKGVEVASCGDKVKVSYNSGNVSGGLEFVLGDGTAPLAIEKAVTGAKESEKIKINAPQTLLTYPPSAQKLPDITATGKGVVSIEIQVLDISSD